MKTIETILPFFTGFYHSVWYTADTVYDCAYNDMQEIDTSLDVADIADIICDIADHRAYEKDVSSEVASIYEANLIDSGYIESLDFQGIYSPKYYNYSTDKINVKLSLNEKNIAKLKKDFDDNKRNPELIQEIKNAFTSYSGFTSFHSNDINSEEWTNFLENEYKVIWLACNLSAIIDGYSYNDVEIYQDVNDCHFCLYYSFDELKEKIKERELELAELESLK